VAEAVKKSVGEGWQPIHAILAEHDDAYVDIAGGRYDWIARMVRAAVVRPRRGVTVITDRIDRVATHPFWGLLLLVPFWRLSSPSPTRSPAGRERAQPPDQR